MLPQAHFFPLRAWQQHRVSATRQEGDTDPAAGLMAVVKNQTEREVRQMAQGSSKGPG